MTIFLERLLHYIENFTPINTCSIHIDRDAGFVQVSKINNTSLFIWNNDSPDYESSEDYFGLMLLANIKAVELNKMSLSINKIYNELISPEDDLQSFFSYERKVVNT